MPTKAQPKALPPDEKKLVDQATTEAHAAHAAEERCDPAADQAKLFWSVASLWFAAAVAAQNRLRFLAWGEYMNRAKRWVEMAQEADNEIVASRQRFCCPPPTATASGRRSR